ncbi:hypothetical protein Ancab_022490 [Ancistrocladus abbreviatus]
MLASGVGGNLLGIPGNRVGVFGGKCLQKSTSFPVCIDWISAFWEEGRFTPNLRSYSVLLNGWCRVKNLMEAGRIWNAMIDHGFKPDIVTHNTMLEGLLKAKRRSDAIKLFEVMKAKGPTPNGPLQAKQDDRSYRCFDEMTNLSCEPDAAAYTCLITGFGNQRKMDKVYGLLKEMKEKGCSPYARTDNALIKLLTNRRMPDDAVRIYQKMI